MDLTIVRIGDLILEVSETPDWDLYTKKMVYGATGASTVTVIRGEKTLLVDTGFEEGTHQENEEKNHQKLKGLLQYHGLQPEDIDYVFLTHLHTDHTGNYALFDHACFFMSAHEYNRSPIPGSEPVRDNREIMDKVSVLYTPGHTKGHASVVVHLDDTIVIAGDAVVSLTYLLQKKFWSFNPDYYTDTASHESVKKILETADYIIPGHGSLFKNENLPL